MNEEEYIECMDYIEQLKKMNESELKNELIDYISITKVLVKRLDYQKFCFLGIKILFYINKISKKYLSNIPCIEEISREYFYLNCIRNLAEKMIHQNKYSDTFELYLCLLTINQIGNIRECYMNDIVCSFKNDKEIIISCKKCADYKNIDYKMNKLKKR